MSILNSAWSLGYFIMDSLLWFYFFFISLSISHVAVFIWRTRTKTCSQNSTVFVYQQKSVPTKTEVTFCEVVRDTIHPWTHYTSVFCRSILQINFLKPSHGLQSRLNYFLALLKRITDTGPFAWYPEHGSRLCLPHAFPSLPSAFTVGETRTATRSIIHV